MRLGRSTELRGGTKVLALRLQLAYLSSIRLKHAEIVEIWIIPCRIPGNLRKTSCFVLNVDYCSFHLISGSESLKSWRSQIPFASSLSVTDVTAPQGTVWMATRIARPNLKFKTKKRFARALSPHDVGHREGVSSVVIQSESSPPRPSVTRSGSSCLRTIS